MKVLYPMLALLFCCGPTQNKPIPYPVRVVVENMACEIAGGQVEDPVLQQALIDACQEAVKVYGAKKAALKVPDAGSE